MKVERATVESVRAKLQNLKAQKENEKKIQSFGNENFFVFEVMIVW